MMTSLYLVSGFLGSGKTSTLKHVIENLKDPQGTVVVVNEAGELGLDGQLVQKAGVPVRELRNGCVCCSLRVDFVALLNEMFQSDPPKRILVEASGLAEPAMLAQLLVRFEDKLSFRKTIVLLDAEIWETREAQGDFFYSQLLSADLILLSKGDFYSADRVDNFRLEIEKEYPGTHLETVIRGRIDPAIFLARPKTTKDPKAIPDTDALSSLESFSYESSLILDETKWRLFIKEEGSRFARIKGQLSLDSGPTYFDFVRNHSNWSAPLETISGNQLVFIGRDLDSKELTSRIERLKF
jgi:G3E family GTPase